MYNIYTVLQNIEQNKGMSGEWGMAKRMKF